jgi:FkbM family methyltransferase
LGLLNNDIIWIEAMETKVIEANNRGITNVYKAIISDKDNEEIVFNISNNGQSSSILELKHHMVIHPDVYYVDKIIGKITKLDTFILNNNLDGKKYNFWNFDIQGAELLALKGATNKIKNTNVIYLEVNEKE